jgi:hypothetical protein
MIDQARRERDQYGGVVGVGLYQLLQQRQCFEAFALSEEIRSFLALGLIVN